MNMINIMRKFLAVKKISIFIFLNFFVLGTTAYDVTDFLNQTVDALVMNLGSDMVQFYIQSIDGGYFI